MQIWCGKILRKKIPFLSTIKYERLIMLVASQNLAPQGRISSALSRSHL